MSPTIHDVIKEQLNQKSEIHRIKRKTQERIRFFKIQKWDTKLNRSEQINTANGRTLDRQKKKKRNLMEIKSNEISRKDKD